MASSIKTSHSAYYVNMCDVNEQIKTNFVVYYFV